MKDVLSGGRRWFVGSVYATHNRSPAVREALDRCWRELPSGWRGLNVGSGTTRVHPQCVNLDVKAGPNVDVLGTADRLPFDDESFDFVMSQEVLEHVRNPLLALREMRRVLKPGGLLYLQVPWIIGLHHGPKDYWRFSVEGVKEITTYTGFERIDVGMAVGPATGAYRVLVEFFAVTAGLLATWLYIPVKAALALALYPVKWLDPVLARSPEADRIAGGYFVIARRP